MQWQGDIEAFEALSGKLKESMEFMNFTAGIEAATASFAMNEKDVELQRTLEGLGGVEAVTQDPAKLKMLTSASCVARPEVLWFELATWHVP